MTFEYNINNINKFNEALLQIVIPENTVYNLPPQSSKTLNCNHVNYIDRRELTNSYIIGEEFVNPQNTIQGGIIAACFDDTFGPLGVVSTRNQIVTVDMNIQYLRPIKPNELFFIVAKVVSIGKNTIYMQADAYSKNGKLLAKSSTNQLIMR